MKKLLCIAFGLLSLQCSANEIKCPSTLNCDYDNGTCEIPKSWGIDSSTAIESFYETLNLSKISASSNSDLKTYTFRCTYGYGEKSSISIKVGIQKLHGSSWIFSGFGRKEAGCKNNEFDNCNGWIADECSTNQFNSTYYITVSDTHEKSILKVDNNIMWIPTDMGNTDYKEFLQYLSDNNLTEDDIPKWPC